MKITVTKVIRELEKQHGWENLGFIDQKWFIDLLIKDVISVIDAELIKHKNITIKK